MKKSKVLELLGCVTGALMQSEKRVKELEGLPVFAQESMEMDNLRRTIKEMNALISAKDYNIKELREQVARLEKDNAAWRTELDESTEENLKLEKRIGVLEFIETGQREKVIELGGYLLVAENNIKEMEEEAKK